ncbi:MAG: hypothetical protein LBT58_00790 [Endomicrobium sp.]|jgi:hypothetical protein|nr:hypothetical protein [Endomicrobium sp.]
MAIAIYERNLHRNGYKEVKENLQGGSMDNELRTGLYNIFYKDRLEILDGFHKKPNHCGVLDVLDVLCVLDVLDDPFTKCAWTDFFSKPLSETPHMVSFYSDWWFSENTKWHEIYDFFEFYVLWLKENSQHDDRGYMQICNELERYLEKKCRL